MINKNKQEVENKLAIIIPFTSVIVQITDSLSNMGNFSSISLKVTLQHIS